MLHHQLFFSSNPPFLSFPLRQGLLLGSSGWPWTHSVYQVSAWLPPFLSLILNVDTAGMGDHTHPYLQPWMSTVERQEQGTSLHGPEAGEELQDGGLCPGELYTGITGTNSPAFSRQVRGVTLWDISSFLAPFALSSVWPGFHRLSMILYAPWSCTHTSI